MYQRLSRAMYFTKHGLQGHCDIQTEPSYRIAALIKIARIRKASLKQDYCKRINSLPFSLRRSISIYRRL